MPYLSPNTDRGWLARLKPLRGPVLRLWLHGLGSIMGFNFLYPLQAYNAGGLSAGITFLMKSNVPVAVRFPTLETVPIEEGGQCATPKGCNQHFLFQITSPAPGWSAYTIPFNALRGNGSSSWDPSHLLNVDFGVPENTSFDVWIDDVAFYLCARPECQPTCTDPRFPVSCRIGNGSRSSCQPTGTDCAAVADWCVDPLLIDDMEDGDAATCMSGLGNGNWHISTDGTSAELTPACTETALLGLPLPHDV